MAQYNNTPEGILVRIKTKLSLALGITPQTLKLLIDKFVATNFTHTTTKTHFTRVNIYNEFTIDKMTIKVFFKFLKIIMIKSVKISVTVTTARGKEVTVSEEIHLTGQESGEG